MHQNAKPSNSERKAWLTMHRVQKGKREDVKFWLGRFHSLRQSEESKPRRVTRGIWGETHLVSF